MSEEINETPQVVDPVIESASATTSPDNSNSGHAAYVIFGCGIALLVILTLGLSSCVSTVSKLVVNDHALDHGNGYELYYDHDGYDGYDDYDYLDDFGLEFDYYFNSGMTAR
ncbi:hypothetical protein [Thermophilibacter provencensis]|uniref:Uncharacterized protein n=1 Tax=Thermophilibacter provencensis TaxID=1852386 RepID=A0ABT7V6Z4_9ACTN|nr:hypothetical protein [Thermophilibacter provencensis]MDM8271734.1 hypothetical protein [Thermophilibacter provencensis]